jgi:hypothetical protein
MSAGKFFMPGWEFTTSGQGLTHPRGKAAAISE